MAVPAQCQDCANDPSSQNEPYSPNPSQRPANLGVVLGVLGGCSLVALVVTIVVPLVRRRVRRAGSIFSSSRSSYRKVRDGDVEGNAVADANAEHLYLPSRRPSFRHQKVFAGPDAQPLLPLLLDPLRPISALTWSDFRSRTKSPSASTDSDSLAMPDDVDLPDPAATDKTSLSTNRATTSHRSTSTRSAREREHRRDELGRPVISDDGAATHPALPSPHRSPTPPGLPSKREYSIVSARRASLPLPITPTSPSDSSQVRVTSGMPLFAPVPSASSTAGVVGSALARHPSGRPRTATQKPGMEPVLEDAAADAYAETRSLQLPSPPASPEQPQPQPQWRGTLSPSSSSSSTRRRPSLTASQSAPTTSPYRPRSSTGPSIPLTAAFQTSVLRSGSQSTTTSSTATTGHRYPSIVTSPPPLPASLHRDSSARARPSSVSVGRSSGALLSPESPETPRPTEAFRRMSTTDIRHRRPSRSDAEQESTTRGTAGGQPRAFLRTSDAMRTTQVQPGLGTSYDPRAVAMSTGTEPSFTTPPPQPLSPPALSPTPPRLTVHTRAPSAGPSAVTWRASPSGSTTSLSPQQQYQEQYQQQYQRQQQGQGPALVRRKDSPALRPIPVSALAGMSLGPSGSRSRSNSVRSTNTSVGTGPVQLPPIDPVTPLTMSLRSSPEDEEGEGKR
ncbi:hypothetical protein BV20DRAFT_725662 [Pilatotrama ljubarskyi]|nr:hypothetical protein BV20DRAFT_725662 [Pilatotrama ljubarskyi]